MSVVTPEFRASWPAVFESKLNTLNNKMEYSITALFKKGEDLTKLKEAAQKALIDKFGQDKSKWPKNLRTPFRDQAEKAKDVDGKQVMPDGHEEGAIFLTLRSENKPSVVDENVQAIIDPAQFYPGCWARASVSVYAYDSAPKKPNDPHAVRGVNFGLVNIQKIRDDQPFGSRTTPEMDFEAVGGGSAGEASSGVDLFN